MEHLFNKTTELVGKVLRNKYFRKFLLLTIFPILFVIGFVLFLIKYTYEVFNNEEEALDLAASFDQTINCVFNGDRDETMSSRLGRMCRRNEPFGCFMCKLLDIPDKDHCEKSIGK